MSLPWLVVFPLERLALHEYWKHMATAELSHAQDLSGRHLVRFINSRIALRIAARALPGAQNAALSTARDALGRLSLEVGEPLFVSLAYGATTGVAALSRHPIGIDYESDPAPAFWTSAARRYCCAGEQRWLAAQPDAQRDATFVWLWTRREAALKYLGSGIRGECRCLCDLASKTNLRSFRLASREGIGTLVSDVPLDTLEMKVIGLGLLGPDDLALTWLDAPAPRLQLDQVHC